MSASSAYKRFHQSRSLKPSDIGYFPTGSEAYVDSDIAVGKRITKNRCQVEENEVGARMSPFSTSVAPES